MLKKNKKQKMYMFDYKIYWKDGTKTLGEVIDSFLSPAEIFLSNKITIYGSGKATYYNADEIKQIEVTNLLEKVDE